MKVLKNHFIAGVFLTCGLWWLTAHQISGQDLTDLTEKEPVKVTGGLGYNAIGYHADGIEERRDPFTWYLNGNLNISIYDFAIPLTFSYTNRQLNYTQPFNQIGITPSYKWVKAHLGYSNMNFSTYSLSGHTFLGGGVELTPGKWNIQAMYGRLNKAIGAAQMDSVNYADPVYKRMGYGAKASYWGEGYNVDVSVFSAKDDVESVDFVPQDSEVTPEDNTVWSIAGSKQLMERVSLNFEYAQSYYNRDTRGVTLDSTETENINTSGVFDAYNFGIAYAHNIYSLLLKYERIDPGYETLGAYYNNNDMENITLNGSLNLLRNQLSIGVSSGVQRNNLEDTEASATRRVVGSVNVNYSPSQQWNFATSYSNFNTYTNVRAQADPTFRDELDTLNFYQVNQSATLSTMYSFGSREVRKSISLNGSYQITNEEATGAEDAQSTFFSGNLAYRFSLTGGTSASAALNGNKSVFGTSESRSYGPNLTLSKPLMNKNIRSTFSGTYLKQETTGRPTSGILNLRLNFGLKPQKMLGGKQKELEQEPEGPPSTVTGINMPAEFADIEKEEEKAPVKKNKGLGEHSLSIGLSYMKKLTSGETTVTNPSEFSELTITLNYSYRF
ncbi:hypothetical protein JMN32_05220 [Fulvivirga sp. 29W222]|uniref:Uncharacterized protein n=1 Tax=Fulvivirga marina TaxID=2494733 RepID=A0A937KCZ2_9BACT|nr:hypothetical protein [Fulvivirga marina]MBL6445698.1 hypothetical protein [Fulvivirga marina]